MLWGHLRIMGEIMQEVPSRVHQHGMSIRYYSSCSGSSH